MRKYLEKVKELNADVGISFDGDGDRVGIITNSSTFIPGDYFMIIIIRDLIQPLLYQLLTIHHYPFNNILLTQALTLHTSCVLDR